MWGSARPLIVLLSLTLNGAFVAGWLSHALPQKCCDKESTACWYSKIGLNDAQMQKLQPHLDAFRQATQAQCHEINRLRRELIDLVSADKPDLTAIEGKQKDILEGHHKMQQLVVEHLLETKSLLTTQQQKDLFDLIRNKCSCSGSD
jgi:Spy/CpxP family protein refolding chaperone